MKKMNLKSLKKLNNYTVCKFKKSKIKYAKFRGCNAN